MRRKDSWKHVSNIQEYVSNSFATYLKTKKLPNEQTYSNRGFPYFSLHYVIVQFGLLVSLQDREVIWRVRENKGTY